jgi:hypothetical protein
MHQVGRRGGAGQVAEGVLVLTVLVVACSAPPPQAGPTTTVGSASAPLLLKEMELAREGGFYLVVDTPAGKLRLMLSAVELAAYPMRAVELGRPRVAFVARRSLDWAEPRTWEGGLLVPERERERREVVVAAGAAKDGADPAPATPPPPPEEEEAPPRFRLLYDGLEVEIAAVDEGATLGGVAAWAAESLRSRWAVLRGGSEPLRLRVTMSAADAASLYRSLPPGTRLLTPALAPAVAAPPEGPTVASGAAKAPRRADRQ